MMWQKKEFRSVKRLVQFLVFSLFCNAVLAVALFWLWTHRFSHLKPHHLFFKQTENLADRDIYREKILFFRQFSFEQLTAKLYSTEAISHGYLERDIALAVLVNDHFFNLQKALWNTTLQMRKFFLNEEKGDAFTLYPGLDNEAYEKILHYIAVEQWPLTTKGLFLACQKMEEIPHTLKQSFFLTAEFSTIKTLFHWSSPPLSDHELFSMVIEGSWELLEQFIQQQQLAKDMSPGRRQELLLRYVDLGSLTAVRILFYTEKEFFVHTLDDQHLLAILQAIPSHSSIYFPLLQSLLKTPRSDSVLNYVREKLPDSLVEQNTMEAKAVLPVIEEKKKKVPTLPKAKKSEKKKYIVREGDTLWQISRDLGISIQSIIRQNQLKDDRIFPGQELWIEKE